MTARVAVIGAGVWGANHVRVMGELGALHTVCDADEARAAATAAPFGGIRVTRDPAVPFADPDVDAVVVATPAVSHAAICRAAIAAGKDVLVEKPMALSVEEADALCVQAETAGRVLAVGHVLEHHPAVHALQELVVSGELGRVRYLYANRLNFGRIRTEENVLWSFAPHDVAIMLRLLRSAPEEVSCHGSSYLNADVADVTLTHLQFPGGVQGHIYVSWIHPFKEHRFVVVGERRMAVFDDTAPWPEKLVVYDHTVDWVAGRTPVARRADATPVALTEHEPLRAQAEAFLDAVATRVTPRVDGRSGAAVLRVLMAAQASMETGGGAVSPAASASTIHPTATVDPGAVVGAGAKIWHYVHVMPDAVIGAGTSLGQNVFVGRGVRVGSGVKVQNNVSLYEGVEVEDNVFLGPSCVFTNVKNPRSEVNRREDFLRTLVREGAAIGANATIVCGSTVGRYAFVGAGAVVTRDVPDFALVVGSPARIAGWMCRCGERLPEGAAPSCASCRRSYARAGDGLTET